MRRDYVPRKSSSGYKDDLRSRWPPIVALLGPSGVGKSTLAMRLASNFPVEIISVDSRQVYQYLDIGTEKPSREDRSTVPHHVLDMVLPDDQYSVSRFRRDALAALGAIRARGRVALLVGGTGHYARALLEGLMIPEIHTDPNRRRELENHVAGIGVQAALAEIAAIDPASAARIDSRNPRRVVRALEIITATKQAIPALGAEPLPALVIGLDMNRPRLYDLVDARIDRQIEAGLIDETRHILDMGYSPALPVLSGLAYGQMVQFLRGECDLHAAIGAYRSATHKLLRRQRTWFRKEPRIQWLDAQSTHVTSSASSLIATYLESSGYQRAQ